MTRSRALESLVGTIGGKLKGESGHGTHSLHVRLYRVGIVQTLQLQKSDLVKAAVEESSHSLRRDGSFEIQYMR